MAQEVPDLLKEYMKCGDWSQYVSGLNQLVHYSRSGLLDNWGSQPAILYWDNDLCFLIWMTNGRIVRSKRFVVVMTETTLGVFRCEISSPHVAKHISTIGDPMDYIKHVYEKFPEIEYVNMTKPPKMINMTTLLIQNELINADGLITKINDVEYDRSSNTFDMYYWPSLEREGLRCAKCGRWYSLQSWDRHYMTC